MIAALAAAGAAACAATVAIVASSSSSSAVALQTTARTLMVAVPIGVGLYAWYRRPGARFGRLLVAVGFGWFLTTFAESGSELLYSTGRVAAWIVEVGLIYLTLAFPTGQLTDRIDRVLIAAGVAVLAILYLPTTLMVESYPVPSPWTTCSDGCPGNAFLVLDREPGFVDALIRPLRELLTVLLFGAVALRLAQRARGATPLMRRTIGPVLVVAIAHFGLLVLAVIARRVVPDSEVLAAVLWLIALVVPALALAFLVGLLRWRLFVAEALHKLALRLGSSADPSELRDALAEAFEDPGVEVAYWANGADSGWLDAAGRPARLPDADADRYVTEVRVGERVVAAIVHDRALEDQRELIEAAGAYATMTFENEALSARLQSSLTELGESRARVLASADEERRRIERDLHDGAQQRLVALRIRLELAEQLVRLDPERGLERLHKLGPEITEALQEIRDLARGVYPSLLADRGLAEAIRAAALRAPVATTVVPDGVEGYPEEIERAVYFAVLEALQNASKHADGAKRITISLNEDERLRFEVRDDGVGFDASNGHGGAGLANIRDRLAAVGGQLELVSSPGCGTVVLGSVPLS